MTDTYFDSRLTRDFGIPNGSDNLVGEVMKVVYEALKEKGYNPVNQIIGYIMSGDPTYITSHKNARYIITKVDRDDILEELLKYYIDNKLK